MKNGEAVKIDFRTQSNACQYAASEWISSYVHDERADERSESEMKMRHQRVAAGGGKNKRSITRRKIKAFCRSDRRPAETKRKQT